MIGRLRGRVAEKHPPALVLDVGGVGYELEAPMSTFYALPEIGGEVTLMTHLVVKEDAHSLYGFATALERALFRSLIRISGVGPKLALAVLSGMRADDFIRCVEYQDSATLTRLPGVGRKTAERLVMEMQDRVKNLDAAPQPLAAAPVPTSAESNVADAVSALVALGYKPAEAARLVNGVAHDGRTSEDIIRGALQRAMK